ncbi:hypothetical protein AVEN_176297-1 [Araneus ventricosus]|uniref:Uncharacterized protein n=1 Tax=Araneus ventricosus TaxID=182803 RepID=A0A4Y2HSV7_ARAVE|nr:hypothetical protein AVEN_176297-1 [Araneus ventricosus]
MAESEFLKKFISLLNYLSDTAANVVALGIRRLNVEKLPGALNVVNNHVPDNCNKTECINSKAHNARPGKNEKIDRLFKDRKCLFYIKAINRVIINADYRVS